MSVLVGIINYLPQDEIIRTKRLQASRIQIEWLNTLLHKPQIVTVAQAYDVSDYVYEDNIYYMKFDKGIGAAKARNMILSNFYNSDYDWLLLCDSDTTAYDYYAYDKFINDVVDNPDKFEGIDAISALEPEYHPYKKLNYEDANTREYYKFEPRELNSGSATSLIRNIKKYYDKELYYPDVDASKGEGREDIEFLIEWLKSGFTWYTMDTWIRKSLCFDYSSIFGKDTKERDMLLQVCLDAICKKYKDWGLQRINGKITWGEFNSVHNRSEKVLYIKRNEPIEFTENEIPKQKTKTRRLF